MLSPERIAQIETLAATDLSFANRRLASATSRGETVKWMNAVTRITKTLNRLAHAGEAK
jgi:hypothetical protein